MINNPFPNIDWNINKPWLLCHTPFFVPHSLLEFELNNCIVEILVCVCGEGGGGGGGGGGEGADR